MKSFRSLMKAKSVHGVKTGNHSNPHVIKAARAYGGSCEVGGSNARPSLGKPMRQRADGGSVMCDDRKRGGRVSKSKRDNDGDSDSDDYAKGGWIDKAVSKPGALHKSLGVPKGEPIPAKKLDKAAHSSNPTLKKRAVLARTLKGFK